MGVLGAEPAAPRTRTAGRMAARRARSRSTSTASTNGSPRPGYEYGPAFQGLRAVWRDGADVLAEVALPEAAGKPGGFGIHPALLDAALQSALLLGEPGDDGRVWLPFAWNGVSLWAAGATTSGSG